MRLLNVDEVNTGAPATGNAETGNPSPEVANARDLKAAPTESRTAEESEVLDTARAGDDGPVEAGALGARIDPPGEGGLVSYVPPEPAQAIAPEYPPAARRRRQEGSVSLRLSVDALGRVRDVSVLESSGTSALDAAALRAASAALFRPARTNGEAVASSLRLTVVFELEADSEG